MNESEIRKILIERLAKTHAGQNAAFIQEMFLEQYSRRADLVMANGKLSVFEIKSPLDNLDRLNGQVETYLKYFEQVTIVCASKHQESVISRVPIEVGVWTISNDGKLKVIQKPFTNKIKDKRAWLSFLPVSELRQFLRENQMSCSGSRDEILESFRFVSITKIKSLVLQSLKKRNERISFLNEKKNAMIKRKEITMIDVQKRINDITHRYASCAPVKAIPRAIPSK